MSRTELIAIPFVFARPLVISRDRRKRQIPITFSDRRHGERRKSAR